MKIIISISKVNSRKSAARLIRSVADEISRGHYTCVAGHDGTKGKYTYDVFRGNPDVLFFTNKPTVL